MADIRTISKERCCGCAACVSACPADAISMEEGEEGFLFPKIDLERCIGCGKCLRSCPEAEKKPGKKKEVPCFAAASKDALRMRSSSGGIFQVFAGKTLQKGGAIYGAAWEEGLSVKHVRITDPEEVFRLSGSKYVPSHTEGIYRQVKQDLDEKRPVLFSGTPCQVAGLYQYLKGAGKKEPETLEGLFTIEIVCHGVPSEKSFHTYLKECYGEGQVKKVAFRTKEFGHTCANGVVTLKNGKTKVMSGNVDPYERGFHRSLFLRKSCYACAFAELPRTADVTLGDFWGLEKYDPALTDPRGVSLVLLNSPKAEALWKEVKEELDSCTQVPVDVALKHNRFRKNSRRAKGRERFFKLLPVLGFEKAVEYALEERYDVMFAWEGEVPPKELEEALEAEANQLGRTVCIQGKEQAVAAVTVSGLQELLGGKLPEELDEEKKAELQKLLLAKPGLGVRIQKNLKETASRAAAGMKSRISAETKQKLKAILKKK